MACAGPLEGASPRGRRWHISLSSWLRDYLYIPLGGNRGSTSATYRNLMATMALGGLWHGASWNFVLFDFDLGLRDLGLGAFNPFLVALVVLGFAAAHLASFRLGGIAAWLDGRGQKTRALCVVATVVLLILLWPARESAFIYFQL